MLSIGGRPCAVGLNAYYVKSSSDSNRALSTPYPASHSTSSNILLSNGMVRRLGQLVLFILYQNGSFAAHSFRSIPRNTM